MTPLLTNLRRLRLLRVDPFMVPLATHRRRGFRVFEMAGWRLVYTPRDHWSRHL